MSYSVNENAYIKIYRKLLNWEWYTDVNATKLFLHCLLKANWKPGRWKGISYEAGEFITSLPSLAKETGLTVRQVRTALTKLKSTGEVTDRVTGQNESKGRVITVIKWHLYQGSDRISDRIVDRTATGLRQDDDRIATADKEYKEYKEYKEMYNTAPPAVEPSADSMHTYTFLYRGDDEPDPKEITDYICSNCPHVFASEFIQYCRSNGFEGECQDWKALANRWEYSRAAKSKKGN